MFVSSLKKFLVASMLLASGSTISFASAADDDKALLRGAGNNGLVIRSDDHDAAAISQEDLVHQRSRSLAAYDTWNGACRKSNGSAGSNNSDFKRYSNKDYNWCRNECSKTNHPNNRWCYGFEYYKKGSDEHCELWWVLPAQYKPADGFKCYPKKGGAPPPPPPVAFGTYKTHNGACRLGDGSPGVNNQHYKFLPEYDDRTSCQNRCSRDPTCRAYEWKHNHCEIWNIPPTKFQKTGGLKCYTKISPI